jgi:hypothetical protein
VSDTGRLGGAGDSSFSRRCPAARVVLVHIVKEARAWISIVFWPSCVYFQRPPSTPSPLQEENTQ